MSNRPDVVVVGTATTRVSPTSGAGEEAEEEGGVHALRTARPCYRRGEGGGGEGRGGVCGGIHQTPFVLMNRPTMVHAR